MSQASWRKSSYSGGGGGNCVEVCVGQQAVKVRDTKNNGTGPELAISSSEWRRFVARVKAS